MNPPYSFFLLIDHRLPRPYIFFFLVFFVQNFSFFGMKLIYSSLERCSICLLSKSSFCIRRQILAMNTHILHFIAMLFKINCESIYLSKKRRKLSNCDSGTISGIVLSKIIQFDLLPWVKILRSDPPPPHAKSDSKDPLNSIYQNPGYDQCFSSRISDFGVNAPKLLKITILIKIRLNFLVILPKTDDFS